MRISVLSTTNGAPKFDRTIYFAKVSEGASVGAPVVQLRAAAVDDGADVETVQYSLLTDSSPFVVTSAGQLAVDGHLDREQIARFELQVGYVLFAYKAQADRGGRNLSAMNR